MSAQRTQPGIKVKTPNPLKIQTNPVIISTIRNAEVVGLIDLVIVNLPLLVTTKPLTALISPLI
jgi:hypothetical protein